MILLVQLRAQQDHPRSADSFVLKWLDANVVEADFWINTSMNDICVTNIPLTTLLIWFSKRRRCSNNGNNLFHSTNSTHVVFRKEELEQNRLDEIASGGFIPPANEMESLNFEVDVQRYGDLPLN